jgi:hypothetical protein
VAATGARRGGLPEGELLARVAVVGVLIGGAFLLFMRAVGGSIRRPEQEAG